MKTPNANNQTTRIPLGIVIILVSFGAACGLVQRSTKVKENTQLITGQVQKLSAQSLLETSDTKAAHELRFEDSAGSYQVEIWPKGKFSFKLGQGFEAEAEKVRITGQQSRKTASIKEHSATAVNRKSEGVLASAEQRQTAVQQHEKQERNPAWGWALILLAVLLIFERFFTKSRSSFVP